MQKSKRNIQTAATPTAALLLLILTLAVAACTFARDGQRTSTAVPQIEAAPAAVEFLTIHNYAETLTVDVPATWTEIDEGPWKFAGKSVGKYLAASPRLSNFLNPNDRTAPGVLVSSSDVLVTRFRPDDLLDADSKNRTSCQVIGRRPYSDPFYRGVTAEYAQCGSGKARNLVTAATSGDGKYMLLIWINALSEHDVVAANRALETFQQIRGDVNEEEHSHDHS